MTKESAVEQLKAMGYDARLEGSIVMVYVDPKTYYQNGGGKLGNVVRSIGYNASWGVRPIVHAKEERQC